MSRTAHMPQDIPYTRWVGPEGHKKLQVRMDISPATLRAPFFGGKTALTAFPKSGPIWKGQPIRPDQMADITGTIAEFKAQIERAKTQLAAAMNPDALAADLISSHAAPIYDQPTRRPVSRMTRSIVAQASAYLGVQYGGTVAPELADKVRDVLAAHFDREQTHIGNVDSLITDLAAVLATPQPADEFAAVRERVIAAVAPTSLADKSVDPEDVLRIWRDKRNEKGKPVADDDDAVKTKRSKMERLFKWLADNREGWPKNCHDMRLVTDDDAVAYNRDHLRPAGISRDHIIDLNSLFKLAKDERLIPANPFRPENVVRSPKPKTTRKLFLRAMQKAILNAVNDPAFIASITTEGQMKRGSGAVKVAKWLHWLAAFAGAAMNSELVKTKIADVQFTNIVIEQDQENETDSAPRWVIQLRGTKTDYRPRTAVLHDSLIREGFLEYVESIRQEYGDDATLFPGWNADQTERLANAVVAEIKKRAGIKDKLVSTYSWRHTTKTRLEKVPGVSPDLARYVTGGTPVDIHAGNYLHPDIDDIKRAIDGLIDPTVEEVQSAAA